jgi:hypothetical protein
MVDSNNDGTYELDLNAEKTGAYRITARYRVSPLDDWIWLGDSGIRDHAVIVGPKAARDMRMYELHVANSNATSDSFADRGTFEDLHEPNENISIDWLNDLGINWIWFQPIHPQGIEGRQIDPATSGEYEPGSPYSIRNFWEINPLYTSNYDGTLPDPVSNPTNYTGSDDCLPRLCHRRGRQVKFSSCSISPFNHTAPDVALGQKGVDIFAATWQSKWMVCGRQDSRSCPHSSSQPMEARVLQHTVIQLKVVVILQLRPTETTSANGATCAMFSLVDMRLW